MAAQNVQAMDGVWRDEFAGDALRPVWNVRKVGTGMTATVASSLLTITTGTTSGDVLELVSDSTVKPPCRLLVSLSSISQRIVNQEFSIELVRSDTPVDVFTTDGMQILFTGTSATQADLKVVSQGDGWGFTGQTIITSASSGLFEMDLTTDEVWFYSGGVDTAGTSKTNALRLTRKVPDPAATYMVRIRAKNTGVPASTTSFVIDSVLVEDYTHLGVEITRSRGSSAAGEQLPVSVVALPSAGPLTTVSGRAVWWDESTTPLAGAATFTGAGRDLMNTNTAGITSASTTSFPARFRGWSDADQGGTLYAEVSRDNVTYRAVLAVPTATVDGRNIATFDIPVYTRYARVRYLNGAVPQTSFTIGSQAVAVS